MSTTGIVGRMMIDDEQGDYGVAAARLGDDAAQTASENLLRQALESLRLRRRTAGD
ncbi:MAG: hypothetical protein H6930_12820 [Rhodoferax sp.]|nr:hypothetical protein [Rhodoferax sp.]